jgi:hypothetical protein
VTIKVTDVSGNETEQTFEVTIVDTTAPTFDTIKEQVIESGAFEDIDWTTYMTNIQDNTSLNVVVEEIEDEVMYNVPGKYEVLVRATDQQGLSFEQVIQVTVVDTTPPEVITPRLPVILLEYNDALSFELIGLLAVDNTNGDITTSIQTTVDLKTLPLGVHLIPYFVTDAFGNTFEGEIEVVIMDTTAPTIEAIRDIVIVRGDGFDIKDYVTVTDNYDFSLLEDVIFSEDFTIFEVGTYETNIQVQDGSGNLVTYDITIMVIPDHEPYIIIGVVFGVMMGVSMMVKMVVLKKVKP